MPAPLPHRMEPDRDRGCQGYLYLMDLCEEVQYGANCWATARWSRPLAISVPLFQKLEVVAATVLRAAGFTVTGPVFRRNEAPLGIGVLLGPRILPLRCDRPGYVLEVRVRQVRRLPEPGNTMTDPVAWRRTWDETPDMGAA